MSAARIFGGCVSILAWAIVTAVYGWLPGLIVSVVAYFVALWGFAVAHFAGGLIGDAISDHRERRRFR